MKNLSGSVAIVTGASRGIGIAIAQRLAASGVRQVLAARNADDLESVARSIREQGGTALAVPTDVTDPVAQRSLVETAIREYGAVDLLVNNAGFFTPSAFEHVPADELDRYVALNLAAPMQLTRLVLPQMLERDRGHIVNIASLGSMIGCAWGEPYTATKHGLLGLTRSLRMSAKVSGSKVSASAICPGFIAEVGIYAQSLSKHGRAAPWVMGTSSAEAVGHAVVRAIEKDIPEAIVSSRPIRPLLVLSALFPRLGEWILHKLGAHLVMEADATVSGRARK
jgi:short-subunit dehydrogenase